MKTIAEQINIVDPTTISRAKIELRLKELEAQFEQTGKIVEQAQQTINNTLTQRARIEGAILVLRETIAPEVVAKE